MRTVMLAVLAFALATPALAKDHHSGGSNATAGAYNINGSLDRKGYAPFFNGFIQRTSPGLTHNYRFTRDNKPVTHWLSLSEAETLANRTRSLRQYYKYENILFPGSVTNPNQ